MGSAKRIHGEYEDGTIRLDTPVPELAGRRLELSIDVSAEGGPLIQARVLHPAPLIELGANLAPMAQGEKPLLVPFIRDLRARLQHATGFPLPAVRLPVVTSSGPRTYRIYLNGICRANDEVRMTRMLAIAPAPDQTEGLRQIAGEDAREPVFDLPARWILPSLEEMARQHGLTVVPPAKIIASHLEEILLQRLPECLTLDLAHALVEASRKVAPKLTGMVIPQIMPAGTLKKIVQRLLARKRHIGAIPLILEHIADCPGMPEDDLVDRIAADMPTFLPM